MLAAIASKSQAIAARSRCFVSVTVTTGTAVGDVTFTVLAPEALVYDVELTLSGVYVAVSVSEPAAREPAAIVTVADPAPSPVAEEA